jgi:large subunit ribosomal protein L28
LSRWPSAFAKATADASAPQGSPEGLRYARPHKREDSVAKSCEICGKGPVVGRQHSHANNVSPRRFEPNLQTVRAIINGGIRRIRVCTRCLRSNKVVKAA